MAECHTISESLKDFKSLFCYDANMAKPKIIDRTQPNPHITALTKYKNMGKLLDIGAGHGRHAIYFAQQGFDVTAIEPDLELINIIKQKIRKNNLKLNILQADIKSLPLLTSYDIIVCAMVLHFLNHKDMLFAVNKIQDLTLENGLNVISAYTDQNKSDFMKDNPHGRDKYLFKPNELKQLYRDWEILEYSEEWTEPGVVKAGDTPSSYHKVNMLARKI